MRALSPFVLYTFIYLFVFGEVSATNDEPNNGKSALLEILMIDPDVKVNEELFLLLGKLDSLGIEEDELSDGYEFIGGYQGFQNYLNDNADRLVKIIDENINTSNNNDQGDTIKDEFDIDEFWWKETDDDSLESETEINDGVSEKNNMTQGIDTYTIGSYMSTPLIYSLTTRYYDKSSIRINGITVTTPFRMEKFGSFLATLIKAKPGSLNPNVIFELRKYYFEKFISDTVKEKFGGANYFLIGIHDIMLLKETEMEFSVLFGKLHTNSIALIVSNEIKLPINFGKYPFSIRAITKGTIMQKANNNYKGWADIGLSLNFDLKPSSITDYKGIIKRKPPIILEN